MPVQEPASFSGGMSLQRPVRCWSSAMTSARWGLQDAGCPAGLLTSCVIVLYNTSRPEGLQEMPGGGGASQYEANACNCGCHRGFCVVSGGGWSKSEADAGSRWGNTTAGGDG